MPIVRPLRRLPVGEHVARAEVEVVQVELIMTTSVLVVVNAVYVIKLLPKKSLLSGLMSNEEATALERK